MPLIPALEKQRQEDLCEFEARLIYRTNSMIARAVTLFQKKTRNINNK